jgi:hypothetical protein
MNVRPQLIFTHVRRGWVKTGKPSLSSLAADVENIPTRLGQKEVHFGGKNGLVIVFSPLKLLNQPVEKRNKDIYGLG